MSLEVVIEKIYGDSPDEIFYEIAEIHQEVISSGFLASLGKDFLILLYKVIVASEYAFLLIAKDDGEIIGFVCGSLDTNKVYSDFMKRAGVKAFFMLFPKLISFKKIIQIFETLIYPSRKVNHKLPKSEILNFCVAERAQDKGIGKKLFKSLVSEFENLGVNDIKIVTGANQKTAQYFYESKGAEKVTDIEIHKNMKSIIYTYQI